MTQIVEIPSLIDMHCHLRDPGFLNKETIETGAKSAKRGGFLTICPMPNTNPPCDSVEVLNYIKEKSKNLDVRILPIACVTKNLDSSELVDFKKLKEAGAIAFSNDGLPILDKTVFKHALELGELIISHCEEETVEVKWQIEKFMEVMKEGKVSPRLHFAHISKKESIDLIREAKKNVPSVLNWNLGGDFSSLSAETCPHYFTFTKSDLTPNGVFKMNPPLGDEKDKNAIIEALFDGTLDVISTDHAPHLVEEKLLPYSQSPNGIVGFETAFSLALGVLPLDLVGEKMSINPMKILKINNEKTIKVDLDEEWIVKSNEFSTKCKISPYDKMQLKGKIIWE